MKLTNEIPVTVDGDIRSFPTYTYDGDQFTIYHSKDLDNNDKVIYRWVVLANNIGATNISAGVPSASNGARYMKLPNNSRVYNVADKKWYTRVGTPGGESAPGTPNGTWTVDAN